MQLLLPVKYMGASLDLPRVQSNSLCVDYECELYKVFSNNDLAFVLTALEKAKLMVAHNHVTIVYEVARIWYIILIWRNNFITCWVTLLPPIGLFKQILYTAMYCLMSFNVYTKFETLMKLYCIVWYSILSKMCWDVIIFDTE